MLDIVLWGFIVLTSVVFILAITKKKPKPPPRPALNGVVLLTVAGKISNPNKTEFDFAADTLFRKNSIYFPAAVEFDMEALQAIGTKKVKFIGVPDPVEYEGPELKAVLKAAGSEYKLVTLYGSTKNQPLLQTVVEAETWIVATKRGGKNLTSGELGPLLLLNHPGGEAPASEDRGRWVSGLYFIEAK